jgi:hypothetical protein
MLSLFYIKKCIHIVSFVNGRPGYLRPISVVLKITTKMFFFVVGHAGVVDCGGYKPHFKGC